MKQPSGLTAALDGEGLAWRTAEGASWHEGADETARGGAAAVSGDVPPGGISWLQTEVEGPGRLVFNWRMAEPGGARCLFMDNGLVLEVLESGSEWTEQAHEVGSGRHDLLWVVPGEPVSGRGSVLLDRVLWFPEDR